MSFGPYPKPNPWVQRKKASCWTHIPSCHAAKPTKFWNSPRRQEEHLPPRPHRISYIYNLLLDKSWASWLQSIHSPQINLGASNRYLGWDFKRCYLVSFNFEWVFVKHVTCGVHVLNGNEKNILQHEYTQKNATLPLNIDKSEEKTSKMIHNENWTGFKFHYTI